MNKKLIWIYLLSSIVYFVQGFEGLPNLSFFFYLKETLHLDASFIMYLGATTTLAWLIKPLWGYLCDYHLSKKYWIIISLIGSILISLYFGLMSWLPITMIVVLLLLGNWNAAIRDVAVDGIMCVEGKREKECGKIQTIQWISITIAGIIVGLVGGYIADHYSYKVGYLALIPIYLIILGIVLKYKERNSLNDLKKVYNSSVHQYQKTTLLENILSYKELFTNKKFLYTCLFIFLFNFNPSFGTPLLFIERDVFKWSGTFMGTLGAIISAISIFGAILYFKLHKKINVKKCLIYSVFIGALTTLCYLYFTPVSAIIYGIIFSVVGMFIFLNVMTFMAESTISGKEATSFALLCSTNNIAATISGLTGAYLFPKVGLQNLILISAVTSFISLLIVNKIKFEGVKKC